VLPALLILKHLINLCRGLEDLEEPPPSSLGSPQNVAAVADKYIPAHYFDYVGESSDKDNCTTCLFATNIFSDKLELVQGGNKPVMLDDHLFLR
jgi:hypothetical protein